jgi:ABC-type lipoprotein export system ATPase subunit
MDPDAPVVELRGISRSFGAEPPVHALRGVDLVIRRGESVAIVGASGSGKSTLLNIIGCLDRQTAGDYLIDGIDVAQLGDAARAALRGRKVGFVFQTFHLLPHRTALENVMLAEVYIGEGRGGRRERALAMLEQVGLSHRAGFMPTKLSGGEQQRVAIARALTAGPSLLLCDEPTGNLDSVASASVLGLFDELGRQGMTLAIVTHDDGVAARAGRRVRMHDGVLTEAA